jgi:formate-dependent nitrite reductase membrane component NrfD
MKLFKRILGVILVLNIIPAISAFCSYLMPEPIWPGVIAAYLFELIMIAAMSFVILITWCFDIKHERGITEP